MEKRRIYIRPEVGKERLSRQDKCLIRNDESMWRAITPRMMERLDNRSQMWFKFGK